MQGLRTYHYVLMVAVLTVCSWLLVVPVATATQLGDAEQVVEVVPFVEDGALYLNADVEFELSDDLQQMALKGVPLYFSADVEITRSRWWWLDKTEVKTSQTWKLVYNALTQQWRVGEGDLLRPESSLRDALYPLQHIRHWRVADAAEFKADTVYKGRLRFRLDTSLLIRPLQVDALNDRSWSLITPWKNFTFSVDALQP